MKFYTNIKAFDSIKIAKTYRIYYIKSSIRKQLPLRTTANVTAHWNASSNSVFFLSLFVYLLHILVVRR